MFNMNECMTAAMVTTGFNPMTLLRNTFATLKTGGMLVVNILGIVLLFAGVVMLIFKILKKGQDQMSWMWPVLALLIGGAFTLMANWESFSSLASAGKNTFDQLQKGPLTTMFRMYFRF